MTALLAFIAGVALVLPGLVFACSTVSRRDRRIGTLTSENLHLRKQINALDLMLRNGTNIEQYEKAVRVLRAGDGEQRSPRPSTPARMYLSSRDRRFVKGRGAAAQTAPGGSQP